MCTKSYFNVSVLADTDRFILDEESKVYDLQLENLVSYKERRDYK